MTSIFSQFFGIFYKILDFIFHLNIILVCYKILLTLCIIVVFGTCIINVVCFTFDVILRNNTKIPKTYLCMPRVISSASHKGYRTDSLFLIIMILLCNCLALFVLQNKQSAIRLVYYLLRFKKDIVTRKGIAYVSHFFRNYHL